MSKVILLGVIFSITFICSINAQQSEFPVLKEDYLGQKPPGMTPEIFAPGTISTDKGELNAMFSPDGKEFYFTIEVIPMRKYTTYFMQQKNNIWSKPIVEPLLDKYQGGEPSISPDGKYLFFRSMLDEQGNRQDNADFWWLDRNAISSAQPKKIGSMINSKYNEAYPSMSSDGILYFHSNREGGEGAVDLYSSQFIDGIFTDPVNLGGNVNSKFPEFHPCISPDGSYLIFSSLNRPKGFGGIDLYVSFRDDRGKLSKAINLGDKINSTTNDYMPFITFDGKYLFFTSTRNKADVSEKNSPRGTPNIYWVDAKLIQQLKPNYLK